ncbi:hypothetical protein WJX81_001956 [Elliptochloris bilobata]|uniref:non-specific serine/threonine protein kinase n=1 Tax=Elliptochloris bilobata TaxID=381761 RepID=A0AAW1RHN9_9CHLO
MWDTDSLGYDDLVCDGVYDAWGEFPELAGAGGQGLPSLAELRSLPAWPGDPREVVVLDQGNDPGLREAAEQASEALTGCCDEGLVSCIRALAQVVAERMGGRFAYDELDARYAAAAAERKRAAGGLVVGVGELRIGLARHRALLFKALADACKLPCRLLRGPVHLGPHGKSGAVAAVLVRGESGQGEMLVELVNAPGATRRAEEHELPTLLARSIVRPPSDRVHGLHWAEDDTEGPEILGGPEQAASPAGQLPPPVGGATSFTRLPAPASPFESEEMQRPFEPPPPSLVDQITAIPIQAPGRGAASAFHEFPPSPSEDPAQPPAGHGRGRAHERGRPVDLVAHRLPTLSTHNSIGVRRHSDSDVSAELPALWPPPSVLPLAPLRNAPPEPPPAWNPNATVMDMEAYAHAHPRDIGAAAAAAVAEVDGLAAELAAERRAAAAAAEGGVGAEAPVRAARPQSALGALERQWSGRGGGTSTPGGDAAWGHAREELHFRMSSGLTSASGQRSHSDEADEWEIDATEIELGPRIGIGSFGEVYRGAWRHTDVAVKRFLEQDICPQLMEDFRAEVAIMKRLKHPNVVMFMGACAHPPNLSIITQFVPRGSLFRLLHRTPHATLDDKRRLKMATDTARGMNYLHSCRPPIIHRDLKSPNLLVDKDFTIKVCDFGLSKQRLSTWLSTKSQAGTPEWTAPEVLRSQSFNEKSDVYSYGVILWELFTGREPWQDKTPMQVVGAVGWGHARLPLPDGVHPVLRSLIARCFAEPAERPSFSEVLDILKPLQAPLAAAAAAAAALASNLNSNAHITESTNGPSGGAAASSAASSPADTPFKGAGFAALPEQESGGPADMRVALEGAQSAAPAAPRKYGTPLYCAAWPAGEHLFVAGGGGKKSSGIANRVLVAQYHRGALSDSVGEGWRGEDAPLRMAATPSGDALVLAMGNGGLMRLDLEPLPGAPPRLVPALGEVAARLAGLGMVKCLAFSGSGRLLALGGDDGTLVVLDWPSLRTRAALRGDKGMAVAFRDLDFSPAHSDKVLATTSEDGACVLWAWDAGVRAEQLELPPGLARGGAFARCRFARHGSAALFTVVNCTGDGHLLRWEQGDTGELAMVRRAKAHDAPITTFDIIASGAVLGTGSSEGEVALFYAERLTPLARVRAAHMVFVTALAFSGDGSALLSVSADASARVTPLPRAAGASALLRLLLLLLACALVLGLMARARGLGVLPGLAGGRSHTEL